jgi:hypothetical protein
MIIQNELQPVKFVMSRDYIYSNTKTKSLAPSAHPPRMRVGSKYTNQNQDKTNPGAPAVNMEARAKRALLPL